MAPPKVPKKALKVIEKPIEKPISKSRKKGKSNQHRFSIYIYKVLKTIKDAQFKISGQSMMIMNNFVNDWLERVASEAGRLAAKSKKNTLSANEMKAAMRLLVPGELAKHANIEGMKALQSYQNSLQ